MAQSSVILVLGSGPNAIEAQTFQPSLFDAIVVINNAWRVLPDWTHHIFPEDFPADRCPVHLRPGQRSVTAGDYIPAQNAHGGIVYAGGTMAFTAGYWALHALRPRVMAFLGCDMVYPGSGATHFYGTGTPDPLRPDVTLQDLSAKSARLELLAARHGCHCVNLSHRESRLVFDRATAGSLQARAATPTQAVPETAAERLEAQLGYHVPSGRYWEVAERFDATKLAAVDRLWLEASAAARAAAAGKASVAA